MGLLDSVIGAATQALGDVLSGLAAKFGLDPAQASALISQHLSGIVDQLTPKARVPEGGLDGLAELAGRILNCR
jgi:uncharacterized protein YidB (DUF937 family)